MLTSRDRQVLTWIQDYKAISVAQCTELFFTGNYEGCRRRLKQLEDMELLKSYITRYSKEKVYYQEKKLSEHDLNIYNFLKVIKKNGGEIIKIKTQPQYMDGKIRPDSFIIFLYNEMVYFILLEVDLTHYTSMSKMQKYEELYKSEELQEKCCNTFPIIVIARPTTNGIRYNSKNFHVIYLDLSYNNINNLLLQNSSII